MGAGAQPAGWVRRTAGGSLVRVRVQPRSRREEITGVRGDAVVVRVQAPPAGGQANEAARRLLASVLGVPASQVELVRGATSREKEFRVCLGPEEVVRRLQAAAEAVR